MSVEVACPNCGKKLRAPETSLGKNAKCPRCGGIIYIPLDAPQSSKEDAPSERTKSSAAHRGSAATSAGSAAATDEWMMLAP
ncbi:MAG TPA: hypothetical protein VFE24_17200, partial [Pirellulales bacterium]|nr:hypothetical protein [Pirellulales bacterium]